MLKDSEDNRKQLISENRKLRQNLEINPNSSKLERRLHDWENDKASLTGEIQSLEERKRELEAGIKLSVDLVSVW